MKTLNPPQIQLQFPSDEQAQAALEAIHFTIRAIVSDHRVYMADPPQITPADPVPKDGGMPRNATVTARFGIEPLNEGEARGEVIAVQGWPLTLHETPTTLATPIAEHVMIDLETYGTRPGCPVISIGAVAFGPNGITSEFHRAISIGHQLAAGLAPDPATVRWWARQSAEARAIFAEATEPPETTLSAFKQWLLAVGNPDQNRIWGNGAGFDQPILTALYETFERRAPWEFYNERCFRTLKSLHRDISAPEKPRVKHNALEDARAQALHAVAILNVKNLWATV